MLVCALVLTDMCNTIFDLIKEAVDCGHRGNRTVSTVVGQIRCFEIGRFAKFIFVCPMAFLAKGIGREFFAYLDKVKGSAVTRMRLEVEEDNTRAVALYKKLGYKPLEYAQMIKDAPLK